MDMDTAFNNLPPLSKAHHPASFLEFERDPSFPYVILVLNNPITRGDLYERCGPRAMAIMAADGGGNRIFDYVKKTGVPNLMNTLRPESIIGDLDSLRPETEKFFRERGTTIVKDGDQYSTDFMKALKHIQNQTKWWLDSFNQRYGRAEQSLKVLVFGGLGGRADQAFSQLHHLFTVTQDALFNPLDLYLITGDSIMFALQKGLNVIDTPLKYVTENIGIIPLGSPARITTQGFEWDVVDWETSFGTQMSTSNHIRAPQVSVSTNERVLFTVEIPQPPRPPQGKPGSLEGYGLEGGSTTSQDPGGSAPSMWSWT